MIKQKKTQGVIPRSRAECGLPHQSVVLPTHFTVRCGADFVDTQISTVVLFFRAVKSVDAEGKAKILRFLSQAKLITPLQRDRHLGRPMLDGNGNYAEDRDHGVRVIDLGAMLAGADLSQTDLRRTDLSDANLVKANLTGCDLVRTNLARSILYEANLSYTNLRAVRFFYGSPETASPRSKTLIPNFTTGEHTGAVVENADFTGVENLSEESRYYCCAWCGSKSRKTIPGGCEGIPNKLDR